MEPRPLLVKVPSPNHWIAREFPSLTVNELKRKEMECSVPQLHQLFQVLRSHAGPVVTAPVRANYRAFLSSYGTACPRRSALRKETQMD